jgi:hypothetical protein
MLVMCACTHGVSYFRKNVHVMKYAAWLIFFNILLYHHVLRVNERGRRMTSGRTYKVWVRYMGERRRGDKEKEKHVMRYKD